MFQTVDPRETTVTRSAPSTGPEWGAPPAVSPEPVPPRPAPAASHTISGTSSAAAVAGSATPGVVHRGAEHQAQQRRQQHRADDEHLLGRQPGGAARVVPGTAAQQPAGAHQPEGGDERDRQHPGQRAAQQDVEVGLALAADHRPRLAGEHLLDEPPQVAAVGGRAQPVQDGDRRPRRRRPRRGSRPCRTTVTRTRASSIASSRKPGQRGQDAAEVAAEARRADDGDGQEAEQRARCRRSRGAPARGRRAARPRVASGGGDAERADRHAARSVRLP